MNCPKIINAIIEMNEVKFELNKVDIIYHHRCTYKLTVDIITVLRSKFIYIRPGFLYANIVILYVVHRGQEN